MRIVKLTKTVMVSAASILLLAGGVTYSINCGMALCCCAPPATDDLAFQKGHCGCGCGHLEDSQAADQNAITTAVLDTKPIQTKFDYIIEKSENIPEDTNLEIFEDQNFTHSPPLILDNKYKPLLC